MNHNDNLAKRLHWILEKSLEVSDDKKMIEAFSEILNVQANRPNEVLKKVGEVYKLPDEIRKEVKKIEGEDHKFYLEDLSRVEMALGKINFGSRWSTFKKLIDKSNLTELKFISKLLSENSKFKPLDEDDLNKLKDKVQSFKNELSDFKIDPDLNRLIFEKVNDIERAIFDYQLTGSALIQKEVESALGHVAMNPKLASKDIGAVRRFYNFLGDISVSLHLIEYTPELNEFMQLLLEKGTG